ncbi:MAG: DNA polymerase III subunit delta', partial [Desulfobacteraceae bacterium]
MPGFDAIIGQPRPIRILTRLLARGILPHALLFTGMEGVGKKTTAAAVIMACNCLGSSEAEDDGRGRMTPGAGGCGTCAACRKIAAGSHPDLRRLAPAGGMIKIEPIRELCAFLNMKPFEARMRAVVITDAQALNPAAGNALLKMLEEPPPQTVMILTTAQAADVLPTIVSRCRQIHFAPLVRRDVAAILMRDHEQDPAT